MRYCDLLLYHQIKPVLVFDGRNLPSKAGTEKKRKQNRAKYKQMAKGLFVYNKIYLGQIKTTKYYIN